MNNVPNPQPPDEGVAGTQDLRSSLIVARRFGQLLRLIREPLEIGQLRADQRISQRRRSHEPRQATNRTLGPRRGGRHYCHHTLELLQEGLWPGPRPRLDRRLGNSKGTSARRLARRKRLDCRWRQDRRLRRPCNRAQTHLAVGLWLSRRSFAQCWPSGRNRRRLANRRIERDLIGNQRTQRRYLRLRQLRVRGAGRSAERSPAAARPMIREVLPPRMSPSLP